MSTATYECAHCSRDTFTSQQGLTQHQQRMMYVPTKSEWLVSKTLDIVK